MTEGSTQLKSSNQLRQRISQLFAEKLMIDVAAFDTDLVDEGLLDSLVFVDLIMHLEETFQTDIPIRDLEISEFRSVARIAAVIERQTSSNKTEPSAVSTNQ